MAVLTSLQLVRIQRAVEKERLPIDYIKPQINAAIQLVEDWFQANRASLATAMDPGGIFSNPQKKAIVKAWLLSKFERE